MTDDQTNRAGPDANDRPTTLSAAEIQASLRTAVRHHQAGRLSDAEQLCRQVLAADGRNADALHVLGLCAYQAGNHAAAIDLIGQAIATRNDVPAYYNNLGNAYQDQGRFADAIAQYSHALALKPDYVQALNNLGNALKNHGKPGEAVAQYERALALAPASLQALNNLGNALQALGRPADAVAQYRRALAVAPDYSPAHNNLGQALAALGSLDEAIAHFEHAIARNPSYAEAHNNLGNALQAQGRLPEAIASYERALALVPNYPQAHSNLGNALQEQEKLDAAVEHYEKALAISPDYPAAHNNLGNARLAQGRFADAAACYERAIACDAAYAQAHHHLGVALHSLGDLARAQQAYATAIDLAPTIPRYYRALLDVRRIAPGDKYLAAMQQLAETMESLPGSAQQELHFALGKAYADLQQYEASFRHLAAGNALKRRETVYNEAETLRSFDRIRAVFTMDLMHAKRGLGDPSTVPVFIIGMPRSGTTLVEQILASHPQVFGAGERNDFSRVVESLQAREGALRFPEIVPALSGDALRDIGGRYLAGIAAAAPGAARITDKMPGNFAYAGLIALALPNARIIHVRRDPIDTCLSCFSIMFAVGQPQTYDLKELGRYYRAYATLMEHWRRVLPPGVMLDVQYEDVVADIARQARRIVAHCGLAWDDSCLAFHQTQRAVRTASSAQVRQDLYRSSVGRWQHYGDLLQPLVEALGLAG